MFEKATPESVGISSASILKYLKRTEAHGLSPHAVLIARGDRLICEAYWDPFDRNTNHRMYSQTKSYVGLAVRLLADEGKLFLDAPIITYFPDKLPETVHPYLQKQTVRDMLMMRTCFDEYDVSWFTSGTEDRVRLYFAQRPATYPGTQYRYDSNGSFVLGALVERLTGKTFLDYLREKCLREIGFSESAYCLQCPGGYAWGDSALLCTPRDMLAYGRLIGQHGRWEGRQLLREGLIAEAFADCTDTDTSGFAAFDCRGYASQFWHLYGNAVGFVGMHGQLTVYDPDTDITFTCTSGNYRTPSASELMLSYLFSDVIENAGIPMESDAQHFAELQEYIQNLKLGTASGQEFSALEDTLNGKTFAAEENRMGITRFSLTFDAASCTFRYTNAQGEKAIRCGRKENIYQPFPESGYSDLVGGMSCAGHTYRCAASMAWGTENQLKLCVQIVDAYIGNLQICFAYRDGHARIRMDGDAENFLQTYDGVLNAVLI